MTTIPLIKTFTNPQALTKTQRIFRSVFDDTGEVARKIFPKGDSPKRFFGAIPADFFVKIDKSKRADVALELRTLLARLAQTCSRTARNIKIATQKKHISSEAQELVLKEIDTTNIATLCQKLKKLLKQPVKMEVLGAGEYGRVFKLTINKKEFVIKTFFDSLTKEIDPDKFIGHGGIVEPILVQFLKKVTNSRMIAKPFFGKISPYKGTDSYIVSEFISEKSRPGINNFGLLTAANPIKWLDMAYESSSGALGNHNQINGIIFDIGGAQLKEYFPNDKLTGKIIRRLCQIIDSGNKKNFAEFIEKNQNNPRFIEAKKYLQTNAKEDYIFAEQFEKGFFSKEQLEMLSKLEITAPKPTKVRKKNVIQAFFDFLGN